MTNRIAKFASRAAAMLAMVFTVVACGGGGGGGGGGGFLGDNGGSSDTYYLTVALKDANGNPTNLVSTTSPGSLQVLVTKNGPKGDPVADIIVTASTDSGLLFPSEGTKLTNSEGLATFRVEAGDGKGAGTIVVSVEDPAGNVVEESINFQLGDDGLRIGYFRDGQFIDGEIGITPEGPIAAKGEAVLSLSIVQQDDLPVESAESVRITSSCLNAGQATITPSNPIPTTTGQISVTYAVQGCQGSDDLTAELIGDGSKATGTIEIASPTADGLTFISADPTLIVLKGTGGGPDRKEQSKVTFQAVNGNGEPEEGVTLSFDLTTNIGGLGLNPMTAVTDAEGMASTFVSSGDVATVVRVIATLDSGDGSSVSAVSDVLSVSTGLPDQNSISLSVEDDFVVPQGMTVDGVTRTLTVRMADKFNNPVPDGTAAVFTTEYGAIQSSCETTGGACSVIWTSQQPRVPTLEENQDLVKTIVDDDYRCPSHSGTSGPCPDDLGAIRGGRSTVLVTAIGEESFIDRNGNGIFDQAEAEAGLFTNLTEAWLDSSENGLYDPATEDCLDDDTTLTCRAGSEELFSDFNNNGQFDTNGDVPGSGYPEQGVEAVYNGLLCPVEGDGVWCSRSLVNVRDSAVLILSASPNWDIALYNGRTPVTSTRSGSVYSAYTADFFNNKPPAGASVSVSATGNCKVNGVSGTEVPLTTQPGAFATFFSVSGSVSWDNCAGAPLPDDREDLTITLTPNDGSPSYSETFVCRVDIVPDGPDPCPAPPPTP